MVGALGSSNDLEDFKFHQTPLQLPSSPPSSLEASPLSPAQVQIVFFDPMAVCGSPCVVTLKNGVLLNGDFSYSASSSFSLNASG